MGSLMPPLMLKISHIWANQRMLANNSYSQGYEFLQPDGKALLLNTFKFHTISNALHFIPYLHIDLYAATLLEKNAVRFLCKLASKWKCWQAVICKHSGWLQCEYCNTECPVLQCTHCQRMRQDSEFPKPIVNKINTETYFHMIAENIMEWIRRLKAAAVFPSCEVINGY